MSKKPASPLRVAIYSRVSSDRQTTDNQERELQAIAGRLGWIVVKVYRDQGISGSKGREGRPAFDALCKDASRRRFDLIAAWSVDRLGRSLQDLVGFLTEIHALGVNLFLHQQGIDTTTPAGKALFQMMGVFAEFERAMIKDRVRAGLERAKAVRPTGEQHIDRGDDDMQVLGIGNENREAQDHGKLQKYEGRLDCRVRRSAQWMQPVPD